MKSRYSISLDGCDDSTNFNVDLSEAEYELILKLCDLSEAASNYGCMPTMAIGKVRAEDE